MPSASDPTAEFVSGLPKAELHVHLEGTLEPELKLLLADRNGIEISQGTVEQVRASYAFDSLASFLAVYYPAMDVLVTEQDFYDLATAYFRRAAADGVRHVEAFFDPQAHTSRGVAIGTVIEGLHRATTDAAGFGVSAGLILCFLRDASADSALATLEAALPYRDRLVGVGLDSDERGNPPAKFAEVFALAREAGLKLTMHCDIDQPGSIENIRQALEEIRVDRIDHGTNILENPALVDLARERGIGLTCCPVSNGFVTRDMKAREIVELLGQGVLVTLNSDDPAYFGAYVADTYTAFARQAGVGRDELVALARNSFAASWLAEVDKAGYLAEIDVFVAAQAAREPA